MMMTLGEAALAMGGTLHGSDGTFDTVGTDSRAISEGQLFIALKGEKFDGHAYASSALEQGASAVVVNKESDAVALSPALIVEDTYQALGLLASDWRQQFAGPVIAVTGSNGKTTVKEMLASILAAHAGDADKVLATKGNLNNHIGMPLTLLSMRKSHQYAVVEMGMNHAGEIRYLTNIAKPDLVLINNAGNAHLGELGSLAAIADAKGEIIEGVAESGTVILNGDDTFFPLWEKLANGKRLLTFGLNAGNDVQGAMATKDALEINTPKGQVTVTLPCLGEHNAKNALAAACASVALNLPLEAIKEGLENVKDIAGRLQRLDGLAGALVINDTYNANPMSMQVAIDVLAAMDGQTVLVAGDMGELGEDAQQLHAQSGEYAKKAGLTALYTLGELSAGMSKAFGQDGQHFESVEALIAQLKQQLKEHTTVLVKGSRFMKMERVVDAITTNKKAVH